MSKIRDVSQLRQVFYQSAPASSVIGEDVFSVFKSGYTLGVRDASAQAFDESMAEQARAVLDDRRPFHEALVGVAFTLSGILLFVGGGFLLGRLTA
jgi:hypothetical protein